MTRPLPPLRLAAVDGPRHERLAQGIIELIETGGLAVGDRLPTHREIAARADVAIGTVTKAIDLLSRRCIVRGEVGRGTFIAAAPGAEAGPIDLTFNVPPMMIEPALFLEASERAARRVLAIPGAELYDLRGTAAQRAALVGWLSRTRVEIDPATLLITVGGQQAIHLAFADLRRLSATIACEAATFPGAIAAAEALGLGWSPVRHDDEGMLPDDLDRVLAETGCRLVYAVPVCQNPFGLEAGEARRRAVLRVAERHGAFIVEDDIYSLYSATGAPTYKALAPDRVYYLTGFSKCLTPLARVGVLVPPADRVGALAKALRAEVFGSPAMPVELCCALIELGADVAAARALRAEAKARIAIAAAALGLDTLPMPEGSPHLWLPMPMLEAERLARRASDHGVRLTPPSATAIGDGAGGLRLCILSPKRRADMERAMTTLAALMRDAEAPCI